MSPSPERPSDDMRGLDAALGQADGDSADFLNRPADQRGRGELEILRLVFWGGGLLA
jgi:hypothetical protein